MKNKILDKLFNWVTNWKMDCPKDLIDWVNSDPMIVWYLWDADLLPEQVHNIKQVCALRGFKFGWETHKLSLKKKDE